MTVTRNHFLLAAFACLLAFVLPLTASARPSGYSSAVCDPDSFNICRFVGATTTWTCDLGATADTYAGDIHAVYDSSGSICDSSEYCAWGTDGNGSTFYCDMPVTTTVSAIRILGTSPGDGSGDLIELQYDEGIYSYDLSNYTNSLVTGFVLAETGADSILGSRYNSADYLDSLHGNEDDDIISGDIGNDEIYGDSGDDTLDGDAGDDILYGDSGVDTIHGDHGIDEIHGGGDDDTLYGDADGDTIYGDDGHDDILGGTGIDTIYGGVGADDVSAGDGDDTVFGGTGADTICGDDGADYLDGQQDEDLLWGNGASDTKDGGPPNPGDTCDYNGVNYNCSYGLIYKPGCP